MIGHMTASVGVARHTSWVCAIGHVGDQPHLEEKKRLCRLYAQTYTLLAIGTLYRLDSNCFILEFTRGRQVI